MNLVQLMAPLLKMAQKQNYFGMKRKKNNMWWISLVGLGISVIALLRKFGNPQAIELDKPNNIMNTMKENQVDIQKFLTLEDKSLLAEFGSEITPKENKPQQ